MVAAEDAVAEGDLPFRHIRVGDDDGAPALVAFGDHLMVVLLMFEDYQVPADTLVVPGNCGFKIYMSTLNKTGL